MKPCTQNAHVFAIAWFDDHWLCHQTYNTTNRKLWHFDDIYIYMINLHCPSWFAVNPLTSFWLPCSLISILISFSSTHLNLFTSLCFKHKPNNANFAELNKTILIHWSHNYWGNYFNFIFVIAVVDAYSHNLVHDQNNDVAYWEKKKKSKKRHWIVKVNMCNC